jgi:hypothetical protein
MYRHENLEGVIEMLWTCVSRGKNKGVRLMPHRFVRDNGRFHLAISKEGPYVAVETEAEIVAQLRRGLSLRMSNRNEGYPPSLIFPRSINGWEQLPQKRPGWQSYRFLQRYPEVLTMKSVQSLQ